MLTVAMNVNLWSPVAQNEVVKRQPAGPRCCTPTLMTSWYGMNFHHMRAADRPWGYPLMIAAALAICGGLYVVLKRASGRSGRSGRARLALRQQQQRHRSRSEAGQDLPHRHPAEGKVAELRPASRTEFTAKRKQP